MCVNKRRQLDNAQGGGELIRLRSIEGATAPTVEGAPVLGGEPGTFQQELEEVDVQDMCNGDGSMEVNDPIPVVPVARLSKCS